MCCFVQVGKYVCVVLSRLPTSCGIYCPGWQIDGYLLPKLANGCVVIAQVGKYLCVYCPGWQICVCCFVQIGKYLCINCRGWQIFVCL